MPRPVRPKGYHSQKQRNVRQDYLHGYLTPSELNPNRSTEIRRRPIQILAYPVRKTSSDKWEFLLLKRIPNRGGFWQGVTGAPNENENLVDAV
jgi:hypothetical protein